MYPPINLGAVGRSSGRAAVPSTSIRLGGSPALPGAESRAVALEPRTVPAVRPHSSLNLRGTLVALLGFWLWSGSHTVPTLQAQGLPEYELPPIRYSATEASNQVTALERRLATGEWQPPVADPKACLQSLLDALDVPTASQVLVFSKTSLQRARISPRHPRAVYFSDDIYVGWVPGGLMELALTDPGLGLAFYHVDARESGRRPKIARDADCLSCHGGSLTRNWPGLMVRSVFPDAQGEPITSAGSYLTGHDSPLAERWGGWYVTGSHGAARHLGNVLARADGNDAILDRDAGANLTDLSAFFPTEIHLRPDSDIVALLVLEHQVNLHSRLVQGALRVRKWMAYQQDLQRELKETVSAEPTGTALRVLRSETERIVELLLFCDEIALPEGGIRGKGDFEAAFRRHRRADPQGRSLKDFDLKTRLFRWRCSYMLHSAAFEALPSVLQTSIYQRLHEILSAETPPARFAHLAAAERAALCEILPATTPGLAAVWQPTR